MDFQEKLAILYNNGMQFPAYRRLESLTKQKQYMSAVRRDSIVILHAGF